MSRKYMSSSTTATASSNTIGSLQELDQYVASSIPPSLTLSSSSSSSSSSSILPWAILLVCGGLVAYHWAFIKSIGQSTIRGISLLIDSTKEETKDKDKDKPHHHTAPVHAPRQVKLNPAPVQPRPRQPVQVQPIRQLQQDLAATRANPNQALEPNYADQPAKAGWCYVGQEKGQGQQQGPRVCSQVGLNDKCMSGNIFPSQQLCVNPNLRP